MNRRFFLMAATMSAGSGWSTRPHAAEFGAGIRFSTREIELIRAWYREQGSGRKPELRNGRSLPPGIAKNLQRGKPLPPGIAKQALPAGLIDQLPPVAAGHERVIVDGRVLLVEVATQIVRDVLTDVVVR